MLALIDILLTVAVDALCLAVLVGLLSGAVMALWRWSMVTSAFAHGLIGASWAGDRTRQILTARFPRFLSSRGKAAATNVTVASTLRPPTLQ